jgi:TolB-like protein
MGEVYRAKDTRLSREVAVKVLPEAVAEDDGRMARFQRESRAVAAISHPNIVAIYDVGREGGVAFSVLELLEGETLGDRLVHGPIAWKDALEIAVAVAEGLAAAHEKGIVHRDLKPANVVLTRDGRVKILDFGVARRLPLPDATPDTSAATQGEPTQPGVVIGTLSYLSPEQARGDPVDGRSDVFSFGALLYEMLTGRRAFREQTGSETLVAILRDDPPRPTAMGVDLPDELDTILFRCLRKDPAVRFQSASDLSFALRMVARGGTGSGPSAAAAAPPGPPAVAVLPFSNLSADAESEYFSDGITEELIHALARVRGLRVAARTSSFAFKGRNEDARVIGQRLGVTALLEGSVRKAGDRLRITAQLVNAADGYHLWSDTYDRRFSDVFAIQEEIAQAIVSRFRIQFGLDKPVALRHSHDPDAYNLYLKGRYFWNRRSQEASRAAIALFERAIEKDPRYALAYAMLADCYIQRQEPGVPHREHLVRAREASEKALELDDSLAQAHSSMARVRLYLDWDWAGADAGFRRALELEPSYAEAHHISRTSC